MRGDPESLRASHSDRTRVETELRLAYQEGRLRLEELDERLTLVHEALTYSDLAQCVDDLPSGKALIRQMTASTMRPQVTSSGEGVVSAYYGRPRRRRGHVGLTILGIFVAMQLFGGLVQVGLFTPLPFFLLLGAAGVFLFRRSYRRLR
ncbi:MAG: DUF1707 SHOCT-like domain-containing protein [Acidimicrobiales bacterium]